MSKVIATRGAQWPLMAKQTLNFTDWFVDTLLATTKTMGATTAATIAVGDVAPAKSPPIPAALVTGKNSTCSIPLVALPLGAIIVSGRVVIETAFAGSTATLSVGIAGATTKYVSALDVASTTDGEFTVTTTVPLDTAGTDLVGTLTLGNADFTAGKVHVFVMYIIDGRINEVQVS